jgi:hypothetical protein
MGQLHVYICAISCLPVHPEHHDAAMTYLGVAGHPKIVPTYLATWLSNLLARAGAAARRARGIVP